VVAGDLHVLGRSFRPVSVRTGGVLCMYGKDVIQQCHNSDSFQFNLCV
jgi:hypothetical protein